MTHCFQQKWSRCNNKSKMHNICNTCNAFKPSWNHSLYPSPWKNCLLWSQSLVPKRLGNPWFTMLLFYFIFSFIFISWRLTTSQHFSGFCHTLAWISHGVTWIPHPHHPSHLPLHRIPLGLPSAPGQSTCLMHPTWAGDLLHNRQYTCCSFKTSHPRLLPQSPKVCLYICVFFSVLQIGLSLQSF